MQGREFRAVLVSTVRSCADDPKLGEQDPFLNDPKVCINYVQGS